jgi:hypothetical protein
VVEDGWIGSTDPLAVPATVIEALWKTRRGPLKVNGTAVRVFRPVPEYDQFELERFTQEAESYVGDTYGWHKLLVQLADRIVFGGRKVFTTAMFIKSRPICSFLVGFVNQMAQSGTRTGARVKSHMDRGDNGKAVYTFGVPPQSLDPDTAMDYCLKNPEEWREVI